MATKGNPGLAFLGGIGVGVGLMYLSDPASGGHRRAVARDKTRSLAIRGREGAGTAWRDLRNRTYGLAAQARSRWSDREADDEVLAQRVRSQLGRVCSHMGAIGIAAQGGRVTLSGPVLADEADQVLGVASRVRGVQGVDNRLEVHEDGSRIPALQGGAHRRGEASAFAQESWSPTARLLAGTGGLLLATWGASRRNVVGSAVALSGLGLLARALTDEPVSALLGVGSVDEAGIGIQKSLAIRAPLDRVWDLWARYENFPGFMENLQEVTDLGGGRSRWVAMGPANAPVTWEAVETRREPRRAIAWHSLPGGTVDTEGEVRFEEAPGGTTRVHVRLRYRPPAGALGHAVAALFLADPKREMDEDLLRMKTMLERGEQVHVRRPRESGRT
jgi:uncharacterized membrane protein